MPRRPPEYILADAAGHAVRHTEADLAIAVTMKGPQIMMATAWFSASGAPVAQADADRIELARCLRHLADNIERKSVYSMAGAGPAPASGVRLTCCPHCGSDDVRPAREHTDHPGVVKCANCSTLMTDMDLVAPAGGA